MDFKNKTALVTGAAVGIGRAVAVKLAQSGAKLVLFDVNFEKLCEVKKEIEKYTKDVRIFNCDISDEEGVCEAVKEAESTFGKIDILINNAALWRCWDTFVNTPSDEWKKFIDVNIMGVVYVTKAVLPKMIESGYGKIVNVASVAGVYGNANMVHYSATKGALISMTKALAKEVADKGVFVNCVSPGTVSSAENPDMNFTQENDMSYLGRTGSDMENANLICFLASDEASYITGQNILIDGGRKKI